MCAELIDSRRLTGPNLLWDHAGAVIDIEAEANEAERLVERWRDRVTELLQAVGWQAEKHCVLRHPTGVSLAISAPMDGLYAATEINEAAWRLASESGPEQELPGALLEELRAAIGKERDDALRALRFAAAERGVRCIVDDEHLSLGAGCGSRTWQCSGPYAEHTEAVTNPLPDPDDVPWSELHDIPIALITGTNGKTTTTRLLAAMARAAGKVVAHSSTDGVWCNGRLVDEGDYSGPGGARLVLRQRDAEIALLETARGGLLRRGLGVGRADVALITNIAEDHLGEFGIADLGGLARVKGIVARAVDDLVLNADDEQLRTLGPELRNERTADRTLRLHWFSLQRSTEEILQPEATAAGLDGSTLIVVENDHRVAVCDEVDIPFAFGGAARHNVANALAAILVARRLGLDFDSIRRALLTFGTDAVDNPGRGNLYSRDGVRIVADFAHNPHGVAAALDMVSRFGAERLFVVIGQAGDRDDASIRGLAEAALTAQPQCVLIKKLSQYSRGRAEGEVAEMLVDRLREGGLEQDRIVVVEDESAAFEELRRRTREGDAALFTVHSNREQTLRALQRWQDDGGSGGESVE